MVRVLWSRIQQERGIQSSVCVVGGGVLLSARYQKGVTDKGTFGQRPEGGEEGTGGLSWGIVFQAQGTAGTNVLRDTVFGMFENLDQVSVRTVAGENGEDEVGEVTGVDHVGPWGPWL